MRFQASNLIDVLEHQSQLSVNGLTIIGEEGETVRLSYKELYQQSLRYLSGLQSIGLKTGDKVMMQLEDIELFLTTFWACIFGGMIPVPIAVGTNDDRKNKLLSVWKQLGCPHVVTERRLAMIMDRAMRGMEAMEQEAWCKALLTAEQFTGCQREGWKTAARPEDIAFLQYSSGSTGSPKGVMLTHQNLIVNTQSIVSRTALSDRDTTLSWLPLTHDFGLIGFHLTPLVAGVSQIIMPTSHFIRDPVGWLRTAQQYGATVLSSPNFGYQFFLDQFNPGKAADGWDLSAIRMILNGAEPINHSLCERFTDALQPYGLSPHAIVPAYGMAEATLMVTFASIGQRSGPVHVDRRYLAIGDKVRQPEPSQSKHRLTFVDLGTTVEECCVRICDDRDLPLEENTIGHIQLQGDNVTTGYYGNAEATRGAFTDDGWLRTGDVGFLRNGHIVITGRSKDIIFINGQNLYPHDIERVAEELEGISLGRIAACGIRPMTAATEALALFVLTQDEPEAFAPLAIKLKRHINAMFGFEPHAVIPLRRIPKTTSGKVQRFLLSTRYQEGRYAEIERQVNEQLRAAELNRPVTLPANDTEQRIADLWRELLGKERIGTDESFFALGGDSLKAATIAGRIRRDFQVNIPIREVFRLTTIRELGGYVDEAAPAMSDPLTPSPKMAFYPLTSAQMRMYMLNRMHPDSVAYNLPRGIELPPGAKRERIEAALRTLILRHDLLRTAFTTRGGEPVQQVHDEVEFSLQETVWQGDLADLYQFFVIPFDLSVAPLLRANVVNLPDGRRLLLLDIHHILADGTSMYQLLREFVHLYEGGELPPIDLQYKDYAVWQRKWSESEDYRRHLAEWTNMLRAQGDIPLLNLPLDRPRPALQSFAGGRYRFRADAFLLQQLKRLAEESNTTMFMVLLAAFNVLLAKYGGTEDVVVGTPVAGRPIPETEGMVGMFVNTLPLRSKPKREASFLTYLHELREAAIFAFDRQEVAFEAIVEKLGVSRDVSRNPLFDAMFLLQNFEWSDVQLEGRSIASFDLDDHASQFDISLRAQEAGDGLDFDISYCADLFLPETIRGMADGYMNILMEIVRRPIIHIGDIGLLDEASLDLLLRRSSAAETPYRRDATIHELLSEQVKRTPDRTAIVFKNCQLTYRELDEQANKVARVLRRHGAGPERIVGIMAERSLEMIVGLFGILKSGAAYLPIDPDFPADRIEYMLEDSKAACLVVHPELRDGIAFQGTVVSVRTAMTDDAAPDAEAPFPIARSTDLAYCIYTSGSTGKPKGVLLEHRSVINFMTGMEACLPINGLRCLLSLTTFTFDIFVLESWLALRLGMTVVLSSEEERKTPRLTAALIQQQGAEAVQMTPSAMQLLLEDETAVQSLRQLKLILLGGEPLPAALAGKLKRLTDARLFNMYGPTETTVWSTVAEVHDTQRITIGKPIANTQIYIVDENGSLQPPGILGELCISGEGLARGYLNLPELTAEKFVGDPFGQGGRMYRTGDLARWLADGNLEHLGRIDHQVKLRGYRIELGEIESVLLKHAAVKEAAVTVHEAAGGDRALSAFFVAEQPIRIEELRSFVADLLPAYMVPTYFTPLARMPLTANGKLDRKALPVPAATINVHTFEAPATSTEFRLAELWQEVLGITRVGRNDHFFELGGHSLRAMILAARIQREFNVEIPLRELFRLPVLLELAAWLDANEAISPHSDIQPVERQEYYPLSSAQKRMYILQQMDLHLTAYNIIALLSIEGMLDLPRLEKAFHGLIQRHESLRTRFYMADGNPVQQVLDKVPFVLLIASGTEADAREWADAFVQPFDLSVAPLLRVGVMKVAEDRCLLAVDMHHIIADGVTMRVLLRELSVLYGGAELTPLRIQYKDFAAWQSARMSGEPYARHEAYWIKRLVGELPMLQLPTDRPRPALQNFTGDIVESVVGGELTRKLERLASDHNATLYMVLLAAFQTLLARYSGQDDLIVGSPVAGRTHADLENVAGMFVNTLALRGYPENDKTFRMFLEETRQAVLEAFEHQDVPFEVLTEKLAVRRDASRNPLFDVMLVLQNMEPSELALNGLTFQSHEQRHRVAKFDLTLQVQQKAEKLRFGWEYSTALFDRETIERWAGHLLCLLEQAAENPDVRLGEINLLTEEERQALLQGFHRPGREYSSNRTFHGLFEEQAARVPEGVAIISQDRRITYGELNKRADRLARTLISRGIGLGHKVGLIGEHCWETFVGILAIMKAGAAFVPIDPGYPEERIRYILQDSGVSVIVSRTSVDYNRGTVILVEHGDIPQTETVPVLPQVDPSSLAYIIYTSGTTGLPKGVMIEHRSIAQNLLVQRDEFGFHDYDRVLQLYSFAFDGSILCAFAPLMSGAAVVVPPEEKVWNPLAVAQLIAIEQVTHFFSVPSFYTMLLQTASAKSLRTLKVAAVAGEALPLSLIAKSKVLLPSLRVANEYGPTESSVVATIQLDVQPDQPITIGRPIPGTLVYILNAGGELQPIGIPGELCISGAGLARGYLNRPELTAERFVDHPFEPGQRMYRTGDLARWLPNGTIEYLGRIDHQVKIRGYRIELGEIESLLMKHAAVKEAVVVALVDAGGDKTLCAYYVLEGPVEECELKAYLAATLPSYMMPEFFAQLAKMPLTPNGKLDRRALPAPNREMGSLEYVAPVTEPEKRLVALWQEVLGIQRVGVTNSFFELGGHSLRAMTLVMGIQRECGVDVPLRELFRHPTVRGLAAWMETNAVQSLFAGIESAPHMEDYPVSPAQKMMYILHQLDPHTTAYNMPAALQLEGPIDRGRLVQAFGLLIARHEPLRTRFVFADGAPKQQVLDHVPFDVSFETGTMEEAEEWVQSFVRPFRLNEAPLLRVGVMSMSEVRHLLVIDMHHIISDGITLHLYMQELGILYTGGQLPKVPAVQYKDFAVWNNKQTYAKEEKYWLRQLEGELPVLQLPYDRPRPAVQSFAGDRLVTQAGAALTRKLEELARDSNVTLYMVLLAAYLTLLMRYSGQEDILVGSPTAGRQHPDIQAMAGLFAGTLVMRGSPQREKTFRSFLTEMKGTVLAAFEHQNVAFGTLVEKLAIPRDVSRNPVFDTLFALHNMDRGQLALDGLDVCPYEQKQMVTKFDVSLQAEERSEGLRFAWEYSTALFERETVERWSQHWLRLLEQIADRPDLKLGEFDLLTDAEQRKLLLDFNDTKADMPQNQSIHGLFEEQAKRSPDRVAVIYKGKQLTYRGIDTKANGVANMLRKQGAGPEKIVGVLAKSTPEMIVGLLGVLKAGAAYLPIDPKLPAERITFMLEDSSISHLLVSGPGFAPDLPQFDGILLPLGPELEEEAETLPPQYVRPDQLAYCIYTSGSTGKPKGVQLEHRSVVNFISGMTARMPFDTMKRLLSVTTFTFDIFVLESWLALSLGLTIVLASDEERNNPHELAKLIVEQETDAVQMTPSLMQMLCEDDAALLSLRSLRVIMLGGEGLPAWLVEKLRLHTDARIFNLYGPTETTVWSTTAEITDSSAITVGKPITNTRVYIVDPKGSLQPIGVPGELCIGGEGVARGYINRPELTNEKFVNDPFVPGGRMYRTGDLACWRADGTIEHLGRLDFQVKIRGYRVELGEIESRLLEHEAVKEAVVVALEETNGEKALAAYYVSESHMDANVLRQHVSVKLPSYMVPSYFTPLARLPLTANGKLDRKALPKPTRDQALTDVYAAPETDMEARLCELWAETLGLEMVGATDHFFESGGHSLKAMKLISRLRLELGVAVQLRELFRHPTVRQLALYIGSTESFSIPDSEDLELIRLTQHGKKNLVCFPGIGRIGYVFHTLTGSLDEWNCFAFHNLDFDRGADDYIRQIRKVQPYGPYTFLAYSAGAALAYPVIRRLEQLGERVDRFVVLDSIMLSYEESSSMLHESDAMAEIERYIRQGGFEDGTQAEQMRQTLLSGLDRYIRFYRTAKFEGPISAEIHRIEADHDKWDDDDIRRLTTSGHYTYQGAGTHYEMLMAPYALLNAKLVKNILSD